MQISYREYLDKVLGGWIGKSIGGAIGARFEGCKQWINVDEHRLFPDTIPPNDDLDLQVLWLKVLEDHGAALTADDLAAAWLEHAWYPFNEYGIFRRNFRLGIAPPESGRFGNEFWETGMGCPIRAEIWGYVFPGAPALAARYAALDGGLDHTAESVGAEQMLAAMSALAFREPDVATLARQCWSYLPAGSTIERLVRAAFEAHAEGLTLREARERVMLLGGHPEACDARINVPFTFLGLLYGGGDLRAALLAALHCGYDTDCTLATAGALLGQILGARRIPADLRGPIGDGLVMGIAYRRPEMTLTALARDTAGVGMRLTRELKTGTRITGVPHARPVRPAQQEPAVRVSYPGGPWTTPGRSVEVELSLEGKRHGAAQVRIESPAGWKVSAPKPPGRAGAQRFAFTLRPDEDLDPWPRRNLFRVVWREGKRELNRAFGVAGAALWQVLGVFYDTQPSAELPPPQQHRRWQHHYAAFEREWLPLPEVDVPDLFRDFSRRLGRSAVIASPNDRVDLAGLIGLNGPCSIYLARTVISPDDRDIYLVVGNSEPFLVYLNGEKAAEESEHTWWAPFNSVWPARLRAGENRLLVKLCRSGDRLDFSLGLRCRTGRPGGFNTEDWCVDLADRNPAASR